MTAKRSLSLPDAAHSGDRLAALRALRDRLAAELHDCQSARDVSALARQFRDTLTEIDSLGTAEPTQEDKTFDELAERRTTRSTDAAVVPRARRRKPS